MPLSWAAVDMACWIDCLKCFWLLCVYWPSEKSVSNLFSHCRRFHIRSLVIKFELLTRWKLWSSYRLTTVAGSTACKRFFLYRFSFTILRQIMRIIVEFHVFITISLSLQYSASIHVRVTYVTSTIKRSINQSVLTIDSHQTCTVM